MTAALISLQAAVVVHLQSDPALADALTGIYDGPPARAAYPYLAIASSASADWSHKTGLGREVSLGLAVHADEGATGELHELTEAVEIRLASLPDDPPGWRIVTWRLLNGRVLRAAAAPWSALLTYRARMISTD